MPAIKHKPVVTSAVKQADGKTIVYDLGRGLFDVFTDGQAWDECWARYRKYRNNFYRVAGNRLQPELLSSLRFK